MKRKTFTNWNLKVPLFLIAFLCMSVLGYAQPVSINDICVCSNGSVNLDLSGFPPPSSCATGYDVEIRYPNTGGGISTVAFANATATPITFPPVADMANSGEIALVLVNNTCTGVDEPLDPTAVPFGIAPPLEVVCPTAVSLPSCSTAGEIVAAYGVWATGFATDGGCGATVTSGPLPPLPMFVCGGMVTLTHTFTAIDDCGASEMCMSTFTVAAASPPLSVTCPAPANLASCATEAAISAAYDAWILGFSNSGGCNPGAPSAAPDLPAYVCGAAVSLTYDYEVSDDCGTETCSSTFDVAAETALTVSCPPAVNLAACTDEATIIAAYNSWQGGFMINDGCNPNATSGAVPTLPAFVCGGAVSLSYTFIAMDDCGTTEMCTSTFDVAAADPLMIACPTDPELSACATEAAINAAYATWAAGFTNSDGCNANVTSGPVPSLPAYDCGGDVNLSHTYTVSDDCTTEMCMSTFTVEAAAPLSANCPADPMLGECSTSAEITAAYNAWAADFTASGGCSPAIAITPVPALPAFVCGGAVSLSHTNMVTDDCGDTDMCTSTFTVMAATALSVDCPADPNLGACTTEADIMAAYTAWSTGFSFSSGCNPSVTSGAVPVLPTFVCGGAVNLSHTYEVTDDCGVELCMTTFTVAAATALSVDCPADVNLGACTTEADIMAAYTTWSTGFSFSDGCNPTVTSGAVPVLPTFVCGGPVSLSHTYEVTDDCGTEMCTADFTVAAATALSVDCPADPNLGACSTEADIMAAYTTWSTGFSFSDGCNPAVTSGAVPALPAFVCGGAVALSHTYEVTDDCGIEMCTTTFTVTAATPLSISCPAAATGTVGLSVADAIAEMNLWANGASTLDGCNPGAITNDIPATVDVCAGETVTVTFSATDDCGTETCMVDFTIPATDLAANISGVLNVCVDGITPLNGNPSGGTGTYTHAWSIANDGGTGATIANLSPTDMQVTNFNATGLTAGMVTVEYSVTSGGCTVTETVNVFIPEDCEYEMQIHDPCICNNDSDVNSEDGTFMELIIITGPNGAALPAGQDWSMLAVTGGYSAMATEGNTPGPDGTPIAPGDIYGYCGDPAGCIVYSSVYGTELMAPFGSYYFAFAHVDNEGYTATAQGPDADTDGDPTTPEPGNTVLSVNNTCFYPELQVTSSTEVCVNDGVFTLTATPNAGTPSAATFEFHGDATFVGGSQPPTGGPYTVIAQPGLTDNGDGTATFDPVLAGVGCHVVSYIYEDNPVPGTSEPGCYSAIEYTITVFPEDDPTFTVSSPACAAGTQNLALGNPLAAWPACSAPAPMDGARVRWYGTGVVDNGMAADAGGVFTAPALAGTYTVCADVGVGSCIQTFCQDIVVLPAVDATVSNFDICIDVNTQVDLTQAFTSGVTSNGGTFSFVGGTAPGTGGTGEATATINGDILSAVGCGTYVVNYTVGTTPPGGDCAANMDFTVTVLDVAPMVTAPADLTIPCTDMSTTLSTIAAWINSATATDDCEVVSLTNDYTVTSIDLCTAATTAVIWTAEDGCGNMTTATANLIITGDAVAPVITVPAAALEIDCGDISSTTDPSALIDNWLATATTSDVCDNAPSLTHNFSMTDLDICAAADYDITVTWTSEDACGNISMETQMISVTVDGTPPTVTPPAAALEIDCGDISSTTDPSALIDNWLATATTSDDCDNAPSLTHNFSSTDLDICADDNYSITVMWSSTDACNNTGTATQVINVTVDNTAPMVTPPAAPLAINCSHISSSSSPSAMIDNWLASATTSDDCDNAPSLTHNFSATDLDICAAADYSITVTWSSTDACDNTGTATQLINVIVDATPPVITIPVAPLAIDCGDISSTTDPSILIDNWLAMASVSDGCDNAPSLSHNFNSTDLDICAMADYSITVTWTAEDACENISTATQLINVTVDLTPPSLTVPAAALTLDCGDISETSSPAALIDAWLAEATATDICDADPVLAHNFDSGELNVCATEDYNITVTWTATDGCGNSSTDTQVITIEVDDVNPTFTTAPENLTLDCGDINETTGTTLSGWLDNVAATDNCDSDVTLTHDYTATSLDVCTGSGSPLTVTWTATDACGNSTTATAILTVTPDDAPPFFVTAPQDITFDCGDINETTAVTISGWLNNVVVDDLCDTDVELTHDYTTTSLDVCTGAGSPLTVTWTATDACNNVATATAILTITPDTAAPNFDVEPQDLTLDCGDINETTAVTISGWLNNVTASDMCDTDVVLTHNYTETSLDVCTGSGSPYTVVWTATDACGNSNTVSAVLTITPDTAPPSLTVPASLALDCGDISSTSSPAALIDAWLAEATATDACDTDPTLSHDFDMGLLDVCAAADYSLTVTWTAVDACDNSTVMTSTIDVTVDVTAPTLVVPAAPLALDCGDISSTSSPAALIDAWLAEAGTSDGCDNAPTLTHDFDMGMLDVCAAADYSITVTWTSIDACNNEITGTQTIDITVDATAPTLVVPAEPLALDCADISSTSSPAALIDAWLAEASTSDGCDNAPTLTHDFDMGLLDVCAAADYSITVTWTSGDACNNVITGTQTIDVTVDNTPPTLTVGLNPVEECEDFGGNNDVELQDWLADNGGWEATDDCTDNVFWSNDFDPVTSWTAACGNTGLYTVNFTATDECGNATTMVSTFTITDLTAPVFTNCPAPDVVEDAPAGWCAAYSNFSLPEAIDNCSNPTVTQIDGTGLSSGSLFPVGTTILTWQAEDDCGNTSLCTRKIIVNDYHTPPTITVAAIDTVENDQWMCGAVVDGIAPEAEDNCPDNMVVTYSITGPDGDLLECGFDDASGFKFPVGTSQVEYTVQDQNLLLISEINQSGATDQIEITNFGPSDLDISCLVITRTAANAAADETAIVPAPTVVAAGDVFVFDFGFDGGAAMPACYTITYGNNNFDEVCVNGQTGTDFTGIIGGPDAYRNTVCDTDDAVDWTLVDACNAANIGTYNPGLPTLTANGNLASLQSEAPSTATASIDVTVIDTENPFCAELDTLEYPVAALPVVINDNTTCTNVTVTVPTNYTVGDVNILNMAGTYADMGDLTFKLSSPSGTTITLFDGLCAGSADFNLGLDSDNPTSVATAPCGALGQGGEFAPVESLKDFYGQNSIGNWTLEITSSGTTVGSLTNFVLEVNELAPYSQQDETLDNDPGVCGAEFTWEHPVHGDNCCVGSIEVAYTTDDGINVPAGGSITGGDVVTQLFEVGTTTVTYTLTDAAGNVGTCSFDVTVNDVELPVANCPADITVGLDGGECGQHLFFPLDGMDNCAIDSIWSVPAPGSFFEIGVHTVTVFVLDPSGNANSCTFNITVNEFPNPIDGISCNNDLNVSLDENCELCVDADMILEGGQYGCYDNFTIAIYTCPDADCPPVVGSPCLGLEHVDQTFYVEVTAPNGNSCIGTIYVEDKLIPEIDCPADIEVKCNASTDPSNTGTPTLLTCELSSTMEYDDVYTDLGQCSNPRATIVRTWTVTDDSGNATTCVQNITIAPFDLADLTFPPNYDDLDNPAIECADALGNPTLTDPSNTGEPMINGEPLLQGGLCAFSTNVTEEIYEICGNGSSYEIFRLWKVRDLCQPVGPNNPVEHLQVIRVMDKTAPVIEGCVSGITMSVDGSNCLVIIDPDENGPVITDECSGVASVTVTSSTGSFELAVGNHVLTYTAIDNCGNESICNVPVEVIDAVVPVAICETNHVVSLTTIDPTIVWAETFDDGSYDACGNVTFDVRRMTPPSNCIDFDWTTDGAGIDQVQNGIVDAKDKGITFWYPAVPFSCCDVGEEHMVEFRVTDEQGNSNTCMVSVTVDDLLDPVISCPADVTYECSEYYNVPADFPIDGLNDTDGAPAYYVNLNGPGSADNDTTFVGYYQNALDNCEATVYIRDNGSINSCGITASPINRFFTAVDGGGRTDVCVQRISVINNNPFYITDTNCFNSNPNDGIIWPCDYDVTCDNNSNGTEPDETGMPVILEGTCEQIAISHTDLELVVTDSACSKILRTWTVIDWCQYDNDVVPAVGVWTYEQIIKVYDDNAPEITSDCSTQYFEITTDNDGNPNNGCTAPVTLMLEATDMCTSDEDLNYTYWIDYNDDGTDDEGGDTNEVSGVYPKGTHRISWSVEDGCGNLATCDYLFVVEDKTAPYFFIASSLSTNLTNGTVDVWATEFIGSYSDECSGDCFDFRIATPAGGPGQTAPPTTTSVTFDAAGTYSVDWWVKDCANNWTYLPGDIFVSPDSGNGPVASISGNIATEDNATVEQITVNLEGAAVGMNLSMITDADGNYDFQNLPLDQNYSVTPDMDLEPLNGVSTFDIVLISRHILQTELLDSPYKMIAADVNLSGSITTFDLVELRKLILFIETEFPVESSTWRFVKEDFVFPTPSNPWTSIFPEADFINGLTADEISDFIAIKKGDVNGSAETSLMGEAEVNDKVGTLELGVEDQMLKAGEEYKIAVEARDFVNIHGYQFTLNFNQHAVDVTDVVAGNALAEMSLANFGTGLLSKGALTTSWHNNKATTVADGATLFYLTLRAKEDISLQEVLSISSNYTAAEAYNEDLEMMDVALVFGRENEIATTSAASFELYQNQPNPFKSETTIGFNLPEDQTVTLVIYDSAGKQLHSESKELEAGYQQFVVERAMLEQSGVLFYEVKSDKYFGSRKMIVME